MKIDLELRVPRSKRAFYISRIFEILLGLFFAKLAFFTFHNSILVIGCLLTLIIPIKSLIRPKYLVMNDEGISIYGYPFPKESLFIKWKEITDISLNQNYTLGSIKIFFRSSKHEPLRLNLIEFCDISDELFNLYFARQNKRIKDLLEALCKAHSVYFKAD